jgi:hypothetical protein
MNTTKETTMKSSLYMTEKHTPTIERAKERYHAFRKVLAADHPVTAVLKQAVDLLDPDLCQAAMDYADRVLPPKIQAEAAARDLLVAQAGNARVGWYGMIDLETPGASVSSPGAYSEWISGSNPIRPRIATRNAYQLHPASPLADRLGVRILVKDGLRCLNHQFIEVAVRGLAQAIPGWQAADADDRAANLLAASEHAARKAG